MPDNVKTQASVAARKRHETRDVEMVPGFASTW